LIRTLNYPVSQIMFSHNVLSGVLYSFMDFPDACKRRLHDSVGKPFIFKLLYTQSHTLEYLVKCYCSNLRWFVGCFECIFHIYSKF